jgi:hypothetical protein
MAFSAFSFTELFQAGLRLILCLALLGGGVASTANEPFLNKPAAEWTEAQALQVLNDSPWAHQVQATMQATLCNYEHPAFPGLYPEEAAQRLDALSPQAAAESVAPDRAEYVVRLNSVKPMQAAAERLIGMGEKYSGYKEGFGLEPGSKPTNLADRDYNLADELTFSVILKQTGPSGESFRDYALPEDRVKHFWECSGIRTADGQYHGIVARATGLSISKHGELTGIRISFPRIVDGKPLITHPNEKVEFRMILNQHVFETSFYVSPGDLFDGTETVLRIPPTVDE